MDFMNIVCILFLIFEFLRLFLFKLLKCFIKWIAERLGIQCNDKTDLSCSDSGRSLVHTLANLILTNDIDLFKKAIRLSRKNACQLLALSLEPVRTNKNLFQLSLASPNPEFLRHLCISCYTVLSLDAFARDVNVEQLVTPLSPILDEEISENAQFLSWVSHQAITECYLLESQPSILVAYVTEGRSGAHEEAKLIIDALRIKGFGVSVLENPSEQELFKGIRNAQESKYGSNGQIVIFMGHGIQGHICDKNDTKICLGQVELTMADPALSGTPKILVIQACQGVPGYDPLSNLLAEYLLAPQEPQQSNLTAIGSTDPTVVVNGEPEPHPYPGPSKPDFYTMISTTTGGQSQRGLFIKELALAIKTLSKDKDITTVFTQASRGVAGTEGFQTPTAASTLRARFCLANVRRPENALIRIFDKLAQ